MQNKYEAENFGVKRLCNVLGYFKIKELQIQPTTFSFYRFRSVPGHSFNKHIWSTYYEPDAICQALRTRWWPKQPQCMIWWDCIIPHQRRQMSPTITLKSTLVHPAGLANNLVFLLREFRNQRRGLSRGNDILRSSGQEEQMQTLTLRSSRGVTRKWLLVTQCYYILQQGACCDSLMEKQSSNASGQSVREMMPRGEKRNSHRKDTK